MPIILMIKVKAQFPSKYTYTVGEITEVLQGTKAQSVLEQSGWLPCDGRIVQASEYPELGMFFAVHNPQLILGDTLQLPDFRSRFVTDKCECGLHVADPKATSDRHSSWCPAYRSVV